MRRSCLELSQLRLHALRPGAVYSLQEMEQVCVWGGEVRGERGLTTPLRACTAVLHHANLGPLCTLQLHAEHCEGVAKVLGSFTRAMVHTTQGAGWHMKI